MKKLGLVLMLFAIVAVTNEKLQARGQPQNHGIVLSLTVEYVGTAQVGVGEGIITDALGIVAKNPIEKEMVMNIGIRRERDVDSCNAIPYSIKKDARKTIKNQNTHPIRADNLKIQS